MGHLLISLIGISLAVIIPVHGKPNVTNGIREDERICKTMECRQVATNILNSMNESAKPCDNFFEFACGNWDKNNPEYVFNNWGEVLKLMKIAVARLGDELKLESSTEDILPVHQIRKLYKSCMEMTRSQKFAAFNAILDQLKGWSMIMEPGTWNSSAISSQEIARYYEEVMGLNAFYEISMVESPSKHGVLQISPRIQNWIAFMLKAKTSARTFMKFNKVNITKKKVDKESIELQKFGEELSKISESPRNQFFENIDAFIKWWSDNIESTDPQNNMHWMMTVPRLPNITNSSKTENTPIRLMNVNYFRELPKLLQSTEKRIIDNFIHSNFMSESYDLIPDDDGETHPIYYIPCDMSREPVAVYLFNRKYYGRNIKAAAEEMLRNIKEAFKLQIKRSNWLSDEAKDAAIEKMMQRKFVLGPEEWYTNETALIDYYKDLTIGDNYVENHFHLKKNTWKAEMKNWGKPIKHKKWNFSAADINVDNVDKFNHVVFPEAVFQSPSLEESVPHYFSYGKIGFLLGFGIGHAFDSEQYSFFKSGINDTGIKSMFNESAQCFIDFFDKYVNDSGEFTLSENLADWYGVQATLDAYNEVKEKKHPNGELKLPGLQNYTDQQMYFLSFSQFFCGRNYNWDNSDEHQPNPYRVIGTLSNTEAFADAFKCPKNSPMNPEKKCDIWEKKPNTP